MFVKISTKMFSPHYFRHLIQINYQWIVSMKKKKESCQFLYFFTPSAAQKLLVTRFQREEQNLTKMYPYLSIYIDWSN